MVESVHVVHIYEVAPFLATSVNDWLLASEHAQNETGHNRWHNTPPILCRSVNVEVAHNSYIHAIQSVVTLAKGGATVLTGCINSDRTHRMFRRWECVDTFVLC